MVNLSSPKFLNSMHIIKSRIVMFIVSLMSAHCRAADFLHIILCNAFLCFLIWLPSPISIFNRAVALLLLHNVFLTGDDKQIHATNPCQLTVSMYKNVQWTFSLTLLEYLSLIIHPATFPS